MGNTANKQGYSSLDNVFYRYFHHIGVYLILFVMKLAQKTLLTATLPAIYGGLLMLV